VGVIQDITERKLAGKIIEESERRYRTLFETAPEGILLMGWTGKSGPRNRPGPPLRLRVPSATRGSVAPLFVAEKDRARAARNMQAC